MPWDVPLEPEQFDNLLRQIQAVKTDLASVVMFWHSPHQQPMITTKLQEHGFTNITDFYWYKANANQAGTTHFVRAVEVATIAMKGGRSLGYTTLPSDHIQRHNHITQDSVVSLSKDGGRIINPSEKPPELFERIFKLLALPHSKVLLLGFGSGSEVIGALSAGLDVVGIENDPKQFSSACNRIRAWAALETKPSESEPEAPSDAVQRMPGGREEEGKEGDEGEPLRESNLPPEPPRQKKNLEGCMHLLL